jgi:hypothetical protein
MYVQRRRNHTEVGGATICAGAYQPYLYPWLQTTAPHLLSDSLVLSQNKCQIFLQMTMKIAGKCG